MVWRTVAKHFHKRFGAPEVEEFAITLEALQKVPEIATHLAVSAVLTRLQARHNATVKVAGGEHSCVCVDVHAC